MADLQAPSLDFSNCLNEAPIAKKHLGWVGQQKGYRRGKRKTTVNPLILTGVPIGTWTTALILEALELPDPILTDAYWPS
jgi:hypothetical protein